MSHPVIDPMEQAYREALDSMPDFAPPDRAPEVHEMDGWHPKLNPTQKEIFDSKAKYVLSHGEKGSGKSCGSLHALARHCYEENDALALIIAPQIRTGAEGVISDLLWVLDIWKNGNIDPSDPMKMTRIDSGMGLDFTEPKLDPQTKDRTLFIANRHGGWSKVLLISIPYPDVVARRMKALSPSFVYADEITELDGMNYFTYVAQQIGRRRGIMGPQQYYASCNPEGPSHWVYKVWWELCILNDGTRDPEYAVFHVPVSENIINLPPGYVEGLNSLFKDPVDRERLLSGKWVDRPSGEALFRNSFRESIHVIGDARKGIGIPPKPGFPIVVSYDPGPRNYCITFEQFIPTKEKAVWIVFDELNFVGDYKPDYVVVPRILERMKFWKEYLKQDVQFVHIGDESAFTHMRHDGSYDATRLKQLSNGKIILRPYLAGTASARSVAARVQMVTSLLLNNCLYVSATCMKTIQMFNNLLAESPKEGKYDPSISLTPKRSIYLHPFDSMSYGMFYFTVHPAMFALHTAQVSTGPAVYRAGHG